MNNTNTTATIALNNTQTQNGYKKSDLGLIPTEWDVKSLLELADNNKKNFDDGDWIESRYLEDSGIRLIQTGNIGVGYFKNKKIKKYISEKSFVELKCKVITEGDILICRLADPAGRACIMPNIDEEKSITSVDVSVFKPLDIHINREYLINVLSMDKWFKIINEKCGGSTRTRISRSELGKLKLPIPPLQEQQKIAEILCTWDEAITNCKKTINTLKARNNGLSQQLLTGKKRLSGLNDNWINTNLGKIAKRVTTKNEELNDTVVTISAQRGFVLQEDFFKKRVASDTLSGYYLIKKGQFAYNKSYSNGYPMGAFKRLNDFEKAVVTTLYICFELKENVCPDYMVYFFENGLMTNNLMKVAKEGGRAHGLLNIGLDDFLNLELTIPSFEEQKAISQVLETANKELKSYETKLEALQLQKKGLMQQLLTGKIRVNVK